LNNTKQNIENFYYSYKGIILLLFAEICFALASVIAKIIVRSSSIPPIEITFWRFLLGTIISFIILLKTNTSFVPQKKGHVLLRSILSTFAFIFFFTAVKYTSITNANMLNMTYPLFIFILTPFLSKKIPTKKYIALIIISLTGIYLIIHPNFSSINIGDIYGLASGITGAGAVLTLRMARKYDSSFVILFYLMSVGLVVNSILMMSQYISPSNSELILLLLSGVIGYIGQAFITYGYKFISARYGSIISSSRVVFATLFGTIILSESISLQIIIGGILIIFSIINIGLTEKQ